MFGTTGPSETVSMPVCLRNIALLVNYANLVSGHVKETSLCSVYTVSIGKLLHWKNQLCSSY